MSSSNSSLPESSTPPSDNPDESADTSAPETSTTDVPTASDSSAPNRSSSHDEPVGDDPTDAKQTTDEQWSDDVPDDSGNPSNDAHAEDTDINDAMKQDTTADAPTGADHSTDRYADHDADQDAGQDAGQTSDPASRTATTADESETTGAPDWGEAPPRSTCANCESPLVGPYCAQCGQRAADRIVPMSEMTREWVEDLFEFDLRIFRTLPTFFFKPGRLTKEYVQGRRVRYVRPLRLYLVASFILFTLLAFTDLATVETNDASEAVASEPFATQSSENTQPARDSLATAPSSRSVGPDSPESGPESPGSVPAETSPTDTERGTTLAPGTLQQLRTLRNIETLSEADRAEIDSITRTAIQQAASSGAVMDQAVTDAREAAAEGNKAGGRSAIAKEVTQDMNLTVDLFDDPQRNDEAEAFIKKRLGQTIENPNAFVRAMVDRAPYVMFLLLPIFALLLKLLYIRRAKLYVQHLIFALHIHALAFFVFAASTGLLITESPTFHTIGGWMTLLPFLYLYVAMHHVYEQGWGKTLFKTFILLTIYNTVLVIGLVGLAIASFLLM